MKIMRYGYLLLCVGCAFVFAFAAYLPAGLSSDLGMTRLLAAVAGVTMFGGFVAYSKSPPLLRLFAAALMLLAAGILFGLIELPGRDRLIENLGVMVSTIWAGILILAALGCWLANVATSKQVRTVN